MTTIAVSGATGFLGSHTATALYKRGYDVRLVVRNRNSEKLPQLPEATIGESEYGDLDASVTALEGTDVLFMVSAAESADRVERHKTFVSAAKQAGVGHIVYTSFVGADPNATFTLARDHGATEEAIKESGLEYTFLRDNFYLDVLPQFADEQGVIRGPAGDGRVAAVARIDVVRTAVAVLTSHAAYSGQIFNLTGPEAITFTEVAEITTDATGNKTTFHNETIDEAYASRAHYGAPDWQVDAWVSTYVAIAEDSLSELSPDVQRVTGNPPITLRELLTTEQTV